MAQRRYFDGVAPVRRSGLYFAFLCASLLQAGMSFAGGRMTLIASHRFPYHSRAGGNVPKQCLDFPSRIATQPTITRNVLPLHNGPDGFSLARK